MKEIYLYNYGGYINSFMSGGYHGHLNLVISTAD